jgi:hypothetical protein
MFIFVNLIHFFHVQPDKLDTGAVKTKDFASDISISSWSIRCREKGTGFIRRTRYVDKPVFHYTSLLAIVLNTIEKRA